MNLRKVLDGVTVTKMVHKEPWQGAKWGGLQITNIRYDSRRISKGDVYVAIRGEQTDGHRFIQDAIRSGALAVVMEDDGAVPDSYFSHEGIIKVVVPQSRKAMALMARNFHGDPSRELALIGITGTNGKTTTSHLVRAVLESNGQRVGIIGTVGHFDGRKTIVATHTTPESPELNELLSSMVANGCSAAVMEVSSHSLFMDRVFGLRFTAAAFTNLTQDHLDFHSSMEEYFKAKKMLFEGLDSNAIAITNADDPFGEKIVEGTAARVITYGTERPARVVADQVSTGLEGTTLTVRYEGKAHQLSSPLIGEFNVSNILAATSLCTALGVSPEIVVEGIRSLRAVRGRFEPIQSEAGWIAVIDYAHTPDALENTLKAIRSLLSKGHGRIITIFGCGGDRDRTKRPIMAEIATRLSDVTIITSDNPRSEDPAGIIREILAGAVKGAPVHTESDRRKAINLGLGQARFGDVVLIAGKGHETYQVIGNSRIHFDDREEVMKFLGKPWN